MAKMLFPLSRTPASYRMPARPSLRAVVQIFKFEWRLIAAYTVGAMLIGTLYCLVTPKLYEASMQIVPGDFTTKPVGTSTAGLANVLLNVQTQSDSVKRFITVLSSPDLAYRLVRLNRDRVLQSPPGTSDEHSKPQTTLQRVRRVQSALTKILYAPDKNTLATRFAYRATSPSVATDFLRSAVTQADDLLRQYNLSEIRYDDAYLNKAISIAQNVDVRATLAQKLVETQLRRMDAERSEYFSIRALGPVEVTEGPVWPQKKLILGGMMILGVLTGIVAALTRVYARNREPEDGQT